MAKETSLSVRVVQVWFQNQRAKMKKMQRRGNKGGNSGGGGGNGGPGGAGSGTASNPESDSGGAINAVGGMNADQDMKSLEGGK